MQPNGSREVAKVISGREHAASGSRVGGFSLVELVVALAVALLLLAVSIPGFLKSWKMYRLSSEASQIGDMLDILRFTAVRGNTTTHLYQIALGANTSFFVDSNKNLALDSTEPQLLLPADMQIMNGEAGVPDTSSMGSMYSTTLPLTSGTGPGAGIAFGSRGTVDSAGATAPYVIVIGYPGRPENGYRAITVTAMGQIKVWTAPSGGAWAPTS